MITLPLNKYCTIISITGMGTAFSNWQYSPYPFWKLTHSLFILMSQILTYHGCFKCTVYVQVFEAKRISQLLGCPQNFILKKIRIACMFTLKKKTDFQKNIYPENYQKNSKLCMHIVCGSVHFSNCSR